MKSVPGAIATGFAIEDNLLRVTRSLSLPVLTAIAPGTDR